MNSIFIKISGDSDWAIVDHEFAVFLLLGARRGEFILVMTINLSIAGLQRRGGSGIGLGYRAFTALVGGGGGKIQKRGARSPLHKMNPCNVELLQTIDVQTDILTLNR